MKKNILIFRTDRIGDLILTCPTIITIKKYFKKIKITLIVSNRNYEYAKKLNIFDQIYIFPKKNIFKKINFLFELRRASYDYIFVFDGKERSIITTAFCRSKNKFAITPKTNFIYKIFKINFFIDDINTNLNSIFQKMLDSSNIVKKINNYKFLANKKNNYFSNNISLNSYIHLHIDEKWFSNLYIKTYTDINPSYDQFIEFLISISARDNVVITTGNKEIELINLLKNKFFEKTSDKTFVNKKFKNSIFLIIKPSFEDIESILRNTKILIACHGAITHASNSFNVKKIDILEKSKENFYKRFSSYLDNYCAIYRNNFDVVKSEIYQKIMSL